MNREKFKVTTIYSDCMLMVSNKCKLMNDIMIEICIFTMPFHKLSCTKIK